MKKEKKIKISKQILRSNPPTKNIPSNSKQNKSIEDGLIVISKELSNALPQEIAFVTPWEEGEPIIGSSGAFGVGLAEGISSASPAWGYSFHVSRPCTSLLAFRLGLPGPWEQCRECNWREQRGFAVLCLWQWQFQQHNHPDSRFSRAAVPVVDLVAVFSAGVSVVWLLHSWGIGT